MAGRLTARERGQRWRRKRERVVGKPRIGRPRGSKTDRGSFNIIMKLYDDLHYKHGHSFMEAGVLVRRLLGVTVTEIMVQTWRVRALLSHTKATRAPRNRNNAGRFVPDRILIVEGNKYAVRGNADRESC